jgi:hypothetical protein
MGCNSSVPADAAAPSLHLSAELMSEVENPLHPAFSVADGDVSFDRPSSPGVLGPEPEPHVFQQKCTGLIERALRSHGINSDPNQFPAPTTTNRPRKSTAFLCESWLDSLYVSQDDESIQLQSDDSFDQASTPLSRARFGSFTRRAQSGSPPSAPVVVANPRSHY